MSQYLLSSRKMLLLFLMFCSVGNTNSAEIFSDEPKIEWNEVKRKIEEIAHPFIPLLSSREYPMAF